LGHNEGTHILLLTMTGVTNISAVCVNYKDAA
jgi:hypothetical protein